MIPIWVYHLNYMLGVLWLVATINVRYKRGSDNVDFLNNYMLVENKK